MKRRKRSRVSYGKDAQAKDNNGVSNLSFISKLPFSVLSEIFFKLPIKSIICCKCVCKQWLNLVSDPNFSEEYAKYSHITPLLLFPGGLSSHVIYLLEFSENGDFNRTLINLKLPDWLNRKSLVHVVGVCNGFLCLRVRKRLYDGIYEVICVINPITGDSVSLPELRFLHGHKHPVKYCYGFDPIGNLFKVLRIVYKRGYMSDWVVEECAIFTVGVDDGWRILSVSFKDLNYHARVTFFNGAFYWIPHAYHPTSLSTFDLAEEKLGQVSIPPDLRVNRLRVFSNRLYLIDNTVRTEQILWTMKKNSILESWTKIVLLSSWLPADSRWYDLLPVAELQDGEILFKDNAQHYLISCNVNQQKCSKIDICATEDFWIRDIQAYVPSFHDSPSSCSAKHASEINCRSI